MTQHRKRAEARKRDQSEKNNPGQTTDKLLCGSVQNIGIESILESGSLPGLLDSHLVLF